MLNLYRVGTNRDQNPELLTESEKASIVYHDLFDFPLDFSDLIRWKTGEKVSDVKTVKSISSRNGFYFLEDKSGVVYKRLLHRRISAKKLLIAKRAAKVISLIPFVKMVAITGSLAMENSSEESDIDFFIITKKNKLWTSRFASYLLTTLFGIKTRKPNDRNQKDKLCLNMWLDETELSWNKGDRNIYTAHEIAQIVPLVNRDKTYEKFLIQNKWVLQYWPNSAKIDRIENNSVDFIENPGLIEKILFKFQYQHMKSRISREIVSPTRALFHPQDWGKVVLGRLQKQ